ncbi:MAG TPA: carboxypeptidase regulatory-like domain-containing protein [Ignavibacteriaceae bacterium]|nr:carboxypeptidase regulatory-like domain-containing protein [Ignavibacteriaceae bacterium]
MRKAAYLLLTIIFFMGIVVNAQPAPPTNLTASIVEVGWNHTPAIKLQWTGETMMQKYNIYKKLGAVADTGAFRKIFMGVRGNMFTDMAPIIPGQIYSYYVTAISLSGESEPSNTVEVTATAPATDFGIVKGTVKDDNGNTIRCARVELFSSEFFHGFMARVDSLGNFFARIPVGTYKIHIGAMGFVPEFYDNVPTPDLATPVTINLNDTLVFNFNLTPMVPPTLYTITGTVKDSLGNPLRAVVKGLRVRSNTHHSRGMWAYTDSLGNYSLRAGENDTVVVYAQPMNRDFFPEFFDNKTSYTDADRLVITGDVANVDFVLSHKPVYQNGITGLVKNSNNEGVESVVSAYLRTNVPNVCRRYTVLSDTLGQYSFNNLVPGEYILLAIPKEGYKPTFFQYNGEITMDWREADTVVIPVDAVVPNIDFTVEPLSNEGIASVVGHVNDANYQQMNGALVYVKDLNNQLVSFALTNASGFFEVTGLEPGTYQVYSNEVDFTPGASQSVTLDYQNNFTSDLNMILTSNNVTGVKDNNNTQVVRSFGLDQNYPNPFNPTTNIKYSVAEKSNVKLTLYNILGKEVMVMVNETKDAGTYNYKLNASALSSGVYFYRIDAGNFTSTKKLTLIK